MLKIIWFIIALIFTSVTTTVVYHKTQKADINYYQGHRLFEKGKFDEAIKFYEKSLTIKPSQYDVLKELAYSYQWKGEHKKAIGTFWRILSLEPKDYKIKKSLAETYSWDYEYQKAIDLYKEVIDEAGDYETKIKLAEVYIWDSQFIQAQEILDGVIKERPRDFKSRLLLAKAALYATQAEKATKIYEELLEEKKIWPKGVDEKELKSLLGESYIIEKDYQKAENLYKDILERDPQRWDVYISLGKILIWQKKYKEAIYYFDIALSGKDSKEIRLLYGKTLLFSADYERAKKILSEIITENPSNREAKIYLADAFAYSKEFGKAVVLYKEILGQKKDLEIKKKLADVLSWDKKYNTAIQLYDEILDEKEDIKVRLQKARVLGWTRQYPKSLKEYRAILNIKDDELINLEMKAKQAYWNNRVKGAIRYYKELVEKGPENAEAMFDLSQVYSYQSMWKEAIQIYHKIIDTSPNHFRAREGLEKAELISKGCSLRSRYEFFEADSTGRDWDLRKHSFFTRFGYPVNYNFRMEADYRLTERNFSDFSDVTENEVKLNFTYVNNPCWQMDIFYDAVLYSKDINTVHTFGSNLDMRFFDIGILNFSHERKRLENNSNAIRYNFYSDNYKERLYIDVNKRLKIGADYLYAYYSDSNYKHEPGFDLLYCFSLEPKKFSVKYRYFYQNFKRKVDDYFTPKGFSTNSLSFNWRHFLNKEEIFFGADGLYYDLGYEVAVDSKDIVGHKFKAEFNWDINKRLNFKIEASTINSSASVYKDSNVITSIQYYF